MDGKQICAYFSIENQQKLVTEKQLVTLDESIFINLCFQANANVFGSFLQNMQPPTIAVLDSSFCIIINFLMAQFEKVIMTSRN